jgi:hypothetical protein
MAVDHDDAPGTSSRAITDLIDERGYFLTQPSFATRAAWTISGLVIIAITGFLGYTKTLVQFDILSFALGRAPHVGPQYDIDWLFLRPWPLYIWLGGLVITLQATVLRHPSLRQQRRVILVTTATCMIVTALLYYYRSDVISFLQSLWNPSSPPPDLLRNPTFYALINDVVLLIFFGEAVWLAVRRKVTTAPSLFIDLKTGHKIVQSRDDLPSFTERITGYLVTRGALALLLTFFIIGIVPTIIGECLSHPLTIGGTCSATDALIPLWILDVVLSLAALIVGLVLLALLIDVHAHRLLAQRGGSYSYAEYGEEMIRTLLDTLLTLFRGNSAALDNPTTPRIPSSLRYLVWPILLLVATLGAALVSQGLQWYLHGPKLNEGEMSLPDIANRFYQYEVVPLGLGLLGGLLLIFGTVFAMAVRLASWRVARDMLGFLSRIGGALIVTFGIYSLALLAFNQLVRVLIGCYSSDAGSDIHTFCQQSRSHPFDPGIMTVISMAVVVIFFGLLVRRWIAQR